MIVQSDSYLEIFLCACGFFFTKAVLLITVFFFRNKFKIAAAPKVSNCTVNKSKLRKCNPVILRLTKKQVEPKGKSRRGVLNGLRELELNQTLREHMLENQFPSALTKALNMATAWACRVCQ